MKRALLTLAALAVALTAAGCISAERSFIGDRVEDLCNGVVPVCSVQATCVLDGSHYVRGMFPGGQRLIVRSIEPQKRLVVRFLLLQKIFPGTELVIQAHSPSCESFDEERLVDIDFFDHAGDDQILEFHLDLPQGGDHLLEIFSDMSAEYLLTIEVE